MLSWEAVEFSSSAIFKTILDTAPENLTLFGISPALRRLEFGIADIGRAFPPKIILYVYFNGLLKVSKISHDCGLYAHPGFKLFSHSLKGTENSKN